MWLTALTYVYYIVAIGMAIYSIYMMSKGQSGPESLAPNSLDDFQITRAEEGTVAPLCWGKNKITGNLMWYGNFVTEPIIEKVDSGKKSQDVVTGYNYYLDVWQALGHGEITILNTWIDMEEKTPTYDSIVYNNGNQETYSTVPGEYANQMKGIAHVFYKKLWLGENVQSLPTIHFEVERLSTSQWCPLSNKNITGQGVNPAAIVYELLRRGGASTSDINQTSFQAAADYWYAKGYGLNIVITRRMPTRDAIKMVLQYVGAAFGRDENNQFYLSALDEDDTSVATLDFDDGAFIRFQFERKTWEQCDTDFVGTFRDENKEYSERTVKTYNPAVARILGRNKPQGVDLKGYRTVEKASARLWEIMKEETYPYAHVQCDVPIRFYGLLMGDVVTVNHAKYGISGAQFRVMQKDYKTKDSNEISLLLRQNTEALWDSNFRTAGGTKWVKPDLAADPPYKQRTYLMPYNHVTGDALAYAVLVARTNRHEIGFVLHKSLSGSDYAAIQVMKQWAQYGTLDSEYPITIEIDETVGLTYTPYQEDPAFDTVALDTAMVPTRLALVDDELMGFATVTLNDDGSITLTDVIRGMFGTPISSHAASADIWLFSNSGNNVLYDTAADFYLKAVPYGLYNVVDIGSCTAMAVDQIPAQIENTDFDARNSTVLAPMAYWDRTGPTLLVLPRFKGGARGAGVVGENQIDEALGTNLPDNIKAYYKTGPAASWVEFTTYEVTLPAAYAAMYVYITIDGVASPVVHFGNYLIYGNQQWAPLSPDYADTNIIKLLYGVEHWSHVMDLNNTIMEAKLNVATLNDVNVAGVAVGDYLSWDVDQQKWVPVDESTFMRWVFDCTVLNLLTGANAYAAGISASEYLGSYYPNSAFDGGEDTTYSQWLSEEHDPWVQDTVWWQIDWQTTHGAAKKISCLRFKARYDHYTDRWPNEIKVVVSDTGAFAGEETVVFNGAINGATAMTPASYSGWTPFTNPTSARYMRIYIQSVYTYDSGNTWVAVDEWEFMEESPWQYVKTMEAAAGVLDAQVTATEDDDGTILHIEGISATPAFDVTFGFADIVASPVWLVLKGYYSGTAGHVVRLKVWNYNTSTWDYLTAAVTDFDSRAAEARYQFGPIGSDYVSGGSMQVKLVHEDAGDSSDDMYIDQLRLLETTSTTTTTTSTTSTTTTTA